MTLLYRVGYYSLSDGGYQYLLLDTTSREEAEKLALLHDYVGQIITIDFVEISDAWTIEQARLRTERLRVRKSLIRN